MPMPSRNYVLNEQKMQRSTLESQDKKHTDCSLKVMFIEDRKVKGGFASVLQVHIQSADVL